MDYFLFSQHLLANIGYYQIINYLAGEFL